MRLFSVGACMGACMSLCLGWYTFTGPFRNAVLVHVGVPPGASEADVLRALGPPAQVLVPSPGAVEHVCRSYHPVPRVQGWQRALVYYRPHVFLHLVFLDGSGKVLCVSTSMT
jgi:hypothetical protein